LFCHFLNSWVDIFDSLNIFSINLNQLYVKINFLFAFHLSELAKGMQMIFFNQDQLKEQDLRPLMAVGNYFLILNFEMS